MPFQSGRCGHAGNFGAPGGKFAVCDNAGPAGITLSPTAKTSKHHFVARPIAYMFIEIPVWKVSAGCPDQFGVGDSVRMVPSALTALTRAPPLSPLFRGLMVTESLSPGENVCGPNPCLTSVFTLEPSMLYSIGVSPFMTNRISQLWGLVNSHVLTVPSSCTGCCESNIAKEW